MYRTLSWVFSLSLLTATGATWTSRDVWAADVFYTNDMESGIGDLPNHGGCYDYSFATVTSPVRAGSHALRVINKGGEDNMNCSGVRKTTQHRAQLTLGDKTFFNPAGVKFWIGFSVFVPSDYPENGYPSGDNGEVIAAQNNAGPTGPEWGLYLRKGQSWRFKTTTNTSGQATVFTVPVTKGEWMDFVIYYKRSWTGDGEQTVWVNGVQKYRVTKSNTAHNYPAGSSNQFTPGIYWTDPPRPGKVLTLYFDSFKFAKGDNGYDLVAPNGRAANLQEPVGPPPPPDGVQITLE